jgi:hypothetical protein
MHLHAETLAHLAKQIQEMQTKAIIKEDRALFDSARHYMIPASRNIYT